MVGRAEVVIILVTDTTPIMPIPPPRTLPVRIRKRYALGLLLALLPMVASQCGGPTVLGNTYMNLWCQPDGIYFTAVTQSFQPSIKFHYEYTVWFNGELLEANRSGDYYTDRYGNQNGMSRKWEDCGHGTYRVYILSVSDDGNYNSSGADQTITC